VPVVHCSDLTKADAGYDLYKGYLVDGEEQQELVVRYYRRDTARALHKGVFGGAAFFEFREVFDIVSIGAARSSIPSLGRQMCALPLSPRLLSWPRAAVTCSLVCLWRRPGDEGAHQSGRVQASQHAWQRLAEGVRGAPGKSLQPLRLLRR
jgi:hypothetical protein